MFVIYYIYITTHLLKCKNMDTEQKQNIEKYKALVDEIKIASLVTNTEKDGLRGRPMSTAAVDADGSIWFFTNQFTEKVEEINSNDSVLLTYTSLSANAYVMINGSAEVVYDRGKMQSLWNPALKAWFPEGLDDPQMKLLKVDPKEVEYWNGSSSKVVFAFQVLKAMVKGETYKDGEHDKISMR